jgi:L-histidine Nalpha-methyltransferase
MTAPLDHDGVTPLASRHSAVASSQAPLFAEALRGLASMPKTLPPKLLYDVAGARLFERITALPEYYLTRAELEILQARVQEIADLTGPGATLIEYGSGAGTKVRLLLDALREPAAYVPIDISTAQLARVAADIAHEYPQLLVRPLAADYTRPVSLPALPQEGPRLAFFPGSTIGNFHPTEAAAFLRRIRQTIGRDGALVLGVDRRKDPAILRAAYDDAAGVTAEFNRNVLRRLNRELGADFDLTRFSHRAVFDDAASRIEMHLVSDGRQTVHVAGERITFEPGETIWTESSYKYDHSALETLVASAGFSLVRCWSDGRERFWLLYLRSAAAER